MGRTYDVCCPLRFQGRIIPQPHLSDCAVFPEQVVHVFTGDCIVSARVKARFNEQRSDGGQSEGETLK